MKWRLPSDFLPPQRINCLNVPQPFKTALPTVQTPTSGEYVTLKPQQLILKYCEPHITFRYKPVMSWLGFFITRRTSHASGILEHTAFGSEPSSIRAEDINDQDTIKSFFISGTNITIFACFPQEPQELMYSLQCAHCVPHWRKTVKNKFKKCFQLVLLTMKRNLLKLS